MSGTDPPPFLPAAHVAPPPTTSAQTVSPHQSQQAQPALTDDLHSSTTSIDLFSTIYQDIPLQQTTAVPTFAPPPSHPPPSAFDVSMTDLTQSALPASVAPVFPSANSSLVPLTVYQAPNPPPPAANVLFTDYASSLSIQSHPPPPNVQQMPSPLAMQFPSESSSYFGMAQHHLHSQISPDHSHSARRRPELVYHDDQKKDPQSWLETMFSKITRKAHFALDSCRFGQSKQTRRMARELRTAIILVSDFLALSINEEDEASTSSNPDDLACLSVPSSPPLRPLDPNSMTIPSNVLDSSRKRTASAMGASSLASRDRPYSQTTLVKEDPEAASAPPLADTAIPPLLHPPAASVSPAQQHQPPGTQSLSQPPPQTSAPAPVPATMMNMDPSLVIPGSTISSRPPSPPRSFVDGLDPMPNGNVYMPNTGFNYSPPFLGNRGPSWSDPVIGTSTHRNSLSSGIGAFIDATSPHNVSPTGLPFQPPGVLSSPTRVMHNSTAPPAPRMTHAADSYPGHQPSFPLSSPPLENVGGSSVHSSSPLAATPSVKAVSPSSDDEDDDWEDGDGEHHSRSTPSTEHSASSHHISEIPSEYRAEVDRIFFEYLNSICSNLEATDSKGEAIHQTLMAKKMQRLDESTDFRPFKFRIQAFTHAFLEELARQGYPDDKIPMKKVRQYLWRQPHILRFNEDGKKAKSKGNHIWNVEGKKIGDGKWEFRPFSRKIAGNPPALAYTGLLWSWAPHIWDPQASFKGVPVQFSSPSLPPWLSWRDNVLIGTPPPDAESAELVTDAKFVVDNKEGHLSTTFRLTIAPSSRRPSLSSDARRATSDSAIQQLGPPSVHRPILRSTAPTVPQAHVMQVLNCAVQRVAQERQTQTQADDVQDYDDLCKQQHVLVRSATAYSQEGGSLQGELTTTRSVLAKAVENVVYDAAQHVMADKALVNGGPPTPAPKVTVNEVSAATQVAVATAVRLNGTLSSEIDIICTASKVLKEARQPSAVTTVNPMAMNQPELSFNRNAPASVAVLNGFPSSSHYTPML